MIAEASRFSPSIVVTSAAGGDATARTVSGNVTVDAARECKQRVLDLHESRPPRNRAERRARDRQLRNGAG